MIDRSDYFRGYKNDKVEAGICADCSRPIDYTVSTRRCTDCTRNANESRRANRHDRVNAGKCHTALCENPLEPGKHKCQECRALDSDRKIKQLDMRKDAGLCWSCGNNPPLDSQTSNNQPVCEDCWFSRVSHNTFGSRKYRQTLKDLLVAQCYRCPYTGYLLVPGKNASIDHKNPVLRFPGQVHDIQNLEWVDHRINMVKRDLTKQEFLDLIDLLYHTKQEGLPS